MNAQSPVSVLALTVERDALLAGLTAACRIVEKRNSIPILDCVLLSATVAGGLTMTATDLNVTTVRPIAAAITSEGSVAVPAHVFLKLAKNLPSGLVRLSIGKTGKSLAVESGRKSFELVTLPAKDFPAEPSGKIACGFSMEAATLRDLLARAQVSISAEETRYYLNGVFLTVTEAGEMRAVSTDGHRLAQITTTAPEGSQSWGDDHQGRRGLILPTKLVNELVTALKGVTGTIEVQHQKNQTRVHFIADGWGVSSKIIDGTFPDYTRVVPAEDDGKPLTFAIADMLAGLDGVTAISTSKMRPVKLTIAADGITLTVCNPELGTSKETIDGLYLGDQAEIGFNAGYLKDLLKELQGDRASMIVRDPGSPVRITDPEDASALYVLMPLRV